MKKYRLTLIGLIISVVTLQYSLINDADLFEILHGYLHKLESFEIDEFIIPSFILILFALLDMFKWQKEHRVEYEKIKIYKAMMASTHHILHNFLNQMQIFKLSAESTPNFDPNILALYNRIMKDATDQINTLGSITDINEVSIHNSVIPESNTQQLPAKDANK